MTIYLAFTLLALFITAAAFLFTHWGLFILDKLREVVKTAGLDFVQLYAAFNQAQLDTKERDAKIEAATDTAAAELHHRIQVDRLEVSGLTLKLGAEAHKLRLLQREAAQ